jgi:hypothetical protein
VEATGRRHCAHHVAGQGRVTCARSVRAGHGGRGALAGRETMSSIRRSRRTSHWRRRHSARRSEGVMSCCALRADGRLDLRESVQRFRTVEASIRAEGNDHPMRERDALTQITLYRKVNSRRSRLMGAGELCQRSVALLLDQTCAEDPHRCARPLIPTLDDSPSSPSALGTVHQRQAAWNYTFAACPPIWRGRWRTIKGVSGGSAPCLVRHR